MTLPLHTTDSTTATMPPLELRSDACTYYAPPLSSSSSTYENHHHHHHHHHHHQPYSNPDVQKKTDLIDRLVGTTAEIIDSIWSAQTSASPHDPHVKVVHTRAFIQEILRRSKTTYSNLQVCLFYLFRVKKAVLMRITGSKDTIKKTRDDHILCCGRRMFLAALMISSKFLQDKNYRNKAWARLSGLALCEINAAEMLFLRLIDYNLYISQPTFDRWHSLLQAYLYRSSNTTEKAICITCYLRSISSHSTPFPSYSPPPLSPPNQITTPTSTSVLLGRPSSFYPSPPFTDELPSATLTPSLMSGHQNSNKRGLDNDDQDHHHVTMKRHCIDSKNNNKI
ncbi:hypothetical protein BCR42DRAFT_376315 [Absidia repens]|uniref:Cyclin-domain-containing protein n=1 Tax=Absidia repens TaxID=90262 RepID=A0A1X2IF51_9FUNG|nr:hypothetical protein BCR42DRAFT_376315 [Absidia repens]